MPNNILEEYNATSEQRIDDKTEIYSVTTKDVGLTVREGVELALLYPQADIVKTYPKDFITRDVAYNLFISLQNNVSGDTANGANWQPLSSNASQSVYDLGVISDDFANGYEATVPPIASYSTSNIYLFKPDNTNTGASTLQINALAVLPIKKYISGAIANVAAGDLNLANTYLLIYKTTYFLIASVSSGGGGVSTFSALTDSPYDNTLLAEALDSKQDRLAGIVSGCVITVETFAGVGTNKQIRVTNGTWYIPTAEHSKLADTVSSEITLCPTGGDFKYYDIVADTSGAITIHEGTPSTAPAHYVIIDPLTEVLLGFITVGDAVIEEPTPVVGGYIPLTGTPSLTGDITTSIGAERTFGYNTLLIKARWVFSYLGGFAESWLQSKVNNYEASVRTIGFDGLAQVQISVGNGTISKTLVFASEETCKLQGDILRLDDIDRNSAIASQPKALITKEFADANYLGSLTQSSQAQVEAAFDNTDQTTPVVLEQTSALTPFNAWWLVQKIKTWVGVGFTAKNTAITGATKTKVTYDSKGLITSGSDATTADIADSTNKRYQTDTQSANNDATSSIQTQINSKQATLTAANFATFVNSTTDKTTPVDADIVPTIDVSTGKRFSLSNLWTNYLKPKADAIYATISNLNLKMNLSMSARTIKLNKTASTANGIDGSVTDLMELMAGCTDNTGSGALLAISTTNTKAIRFTSGASILRSFAGGTDGAILVCQNSNSALMSVNHEDTAETTVANRIYTGGQNVQVGIGGVFVLQYKTSNSRWNLIGGNGLNYWSVFAGSSNRLVEVDTNGVGSASKSLQDIDFTPAQKTSATTGSWTGVNEITISGLKQGQYYADVAGGFNYECHVNDKCNRTPNVNLTPITTNLIYPLNEITGTSGTLIGDNSYILNNASQVVMALPATGVQGDVIPISGKGAGGWRVTVPNTQQIVGGLTNTLTNGSGYIQAGQYAAVTLKCITGGTAAVWEIICINPATTLTIV